MSAPEIEWFDKTNGDILITEMPDLMVQAQRAQFGGDEGPPLGLSNWLMCEAFNHRFDPAHARALHLAAMIVSRVAADTWLDTPAETGWYWHDDGVSPATIDFVFPRPGHAYLCVLGEPNHVTSKREFKPVARMRGKWLLIPPKVMKFSPLKVKDLPGNWPEDASHENGDYECRCVECGSTFYGHKRRPMCKVCAMIPPLPEEMIGRGEMPAWRAGYRAARYEK